MAKRWPEVLDGLWVPTTNRTWNALLSFFGWAMIAEGEGGAGFRQGRSMTVRSRLNATIPIFCRAMLMLDDLNSTAHPRSF